MFIDVVTILLLFYILVFGSKECGTLVLPPGIKPTPPALVGEVSTTTPSEKSLKWFFKNHYNIVK